MSFKSNPSKQAQEMIFSRKTKKTSHPSLRFNNSIVSLTQYQKHLGIFLDAQLKVITTRVNKTIGMLWKLQIALPRLVSMAIYKTFVRSHLDHGDIIYDEAHNETCHKKLESFQYNVCLARSGTIRGSSREKVCHELG